MGLGLQKIIVQTEQVWESHLEDWWVLVTHSEEGNDFEERL